MGKKKKIKRIIIFVLLILLIAVTLYLIWFIRINSIYNRMIESESNLYTPQEGSSLYEDSDGYYYSINKSVVSESLENSSRFEFFIVPKAFGKFTYYIEFIDDNDEQKGRIIYCDKNGKPIDTYDNSYVKSHLKRINKLVKKANDIWILK